MPNSSIKESETINEFTETVITNDKNSNLPMSSDTQENKQNKLGLNSKDKNDAVDKSLLTNSAADTEQYDEMSESIKYRYTLNILYELRESPHSKVRPKCIDNPSLISRGLWKTELSNSTSTIASSGGGFYEYDRHGNERTRNMNTISNTGGGQSSQTDVGPSGGGRDGNLKRRPGDPRERVKKENDIVLSPQRRTFNMGIAVPSFLNAQIPPPLISRSDRESNSRGRIGSGRILNRDVSWDYKPNKDNAEPEISFRPGGGLMGLRDRDRGVDRESQNTTSSSGSTSSSNVNNYNSIYRNSDEKHDRRSYSRDVDRDHRDDNKGSIHRGGRNRYQYNNYDVGNHHHRGGFDNRDEEPEWFSSGPTSQNDTIELRGFDDPRDEQNNDKKTSPKKSDLKRETVTRGSQNVVPSKSEDTTTPYTKEDNNNNGKNDKDSLLVKNETEKSQFNRSNSSSLEPHLEYEQEFEFEEFFKLDSIGGLLPDDQKDKRSSRFSQWFKRCSPNGFDQMLSQGVGENNQMQNNDSNRAVLHDELNNIMNDFDDPSHMMIKRLDGQYNDHQQQHSQQMHYDDVNGKMASGCDPTKYFSPISPAGNTTVSNQLMEILKRNEMAGNVGTSDRPLPNHKQIPSVEELEARMLQTGLKSAPFDMQNPLRQRIPTQKDQMLSEAVIQQQDMVAFKKLLSQMTDKNIDIKNVDMLETNNQQPFLSGGNNSVGGLNLLQLLNKQQRHEDMKHQQQQQGSGYPQIGNLSIQQNFLSATNRVNPTGSNAAMTRQIQGGGGGGANGNVFQNILPIGHSQQQHQIAVPKQQGIDMNQGETIKRSEQPILDSLSYNEVLQANLFQQLSNPNIPQRQREMYSTISSLLIPPPPPIPSVHQSQLPSPNALQQQQQQIHGNIPVSIFGPPQNQQPPQTSTQGQTTNASSSTVDALNTSHLMFPSQVQQPIRLSPLPNGLPQRIPSPRELQFHTQSIMQNALIKKKLEEQRENFRKRQEMQQQQNQQHQSSSGNMPNNESQAMSTTENTKVSAPSPAKQCHVSSPTPLAFTPTSVLRKMTAEKDDGASSTHINSGNLDIQSNANIIAMSQALSNTQGSKNITSVASGSSVGTQQNNLIKNHHQQRMQMNSMPQRQQQPNPNHSTVAAIMQQQLKWNQQMAVAIANNNQQPNNSKPIGRPILKGSTSMQYATNIEYQQLQQQFNKRKQSGNISSGPILPQQLQSQNILQQIPQHSQANSPQPISGNSQLQQLLNHRHHQQQQQQQSQQQIVENIQFEHVEEGCVVQEVENIQIENLLGNALSNENITIQFEENEIIQPADDLFVLYKCPICFKYMQTEEEMQNHIKTYMSEADNSVFVCKYCSFSTRILRKFQTHYASHIEKKPFECDYCAKSFKQYDSYTRHVTQHVIQRT